MAATALLRARIEMISIMVASKGRPMMKAVIPEIRKARRRKMESEEYMNRKQEEAERQRLVYISIRLSRVR